jgi:hypothetical protein
VLQAVCLVLLAVNGSPLAVIARMLATCRTGTPPMSRHGAILSRHGAVRGGTLTVPGPAPRDLPTRVVCPRAVPRGQLEITFGADLIALGCCPIAPVSTRITASGRTSAPRDALAAFVRVALAGVAHQVVQAGVATCHEIAIACPLVNV